MNWKNTDQIATNPKKQYYFKQSELGVIYDCDKQIMSEFLIDLSVPWYLIGRTKKYRLWEVEEAVEKRRHMEKDGVG